MSILTCHSCQSFIIRRTKDRPLEDEAKIRLAKLKYDAEKFEEAEELAKDFAVFINPRTPKDQVTKGQISLDFHVEVNAE